MIGGLESVKAGDEFPEADVVDGVDDVAAIVVAAAVVVGHFLNCLKSLTTCFGFDATGVCTDAAAVIDVDEVIVVEAPFVVINGFGVWMDGAVPVAGLIVGAGTELAFGDVDPDSTCLSVMVVPVGIG